MPPRARSLCDAHDAVGGAVVGGLAIDAPSPSEGAVGSVRYALDVLRECLAVVAYVADAEERNGFDRSAAHYRRLWGLGQDAVPGLRRIVVGADTLPLSLLDHVVMGLDRLARNVETLVRVAAPGESGAR